MVSLLLPVIYLAFISLGLPDALLGAAWPSMYPQLGAGVSWAGGVSMIISVGTIVSSLASDWLNNKLGTGRVTALSVATTAVALFGFSTCTQFWQLCLWAMPYGLGAGSVDAALNNYVALHYESRHMSWLHCMWGIGAAGGPVIMGWALAGSTWQNGYHIVSVLQFVLTALLLFSLPLWQTPADAGAGEEFTPEHRTISELLKVPGVPEVMLCFAFYSGVEGIAGMWAASYCTLTRGLDAMTAASWASLFYVGITVGRFFSGFLTMKFNDQQMIRMGQLLNAVGIVLILLPFGNALLPVGLVVAGLGCAPIYPSIIHETPSNFGKNLSMSMTGLQMAAAYTGSTLLSPFFGVLAQNITMKLYPFVLLLMLVLMTVFPSSCTERRLQNGQEMPEAEPPFDKGGFFVFPPLLLFPTLSCIIKAKEEVSLCKNAACAADGSSMAGVRTVVCPSRRSTATPCGARVPTITASTARMFPTACGPRAIAPRWKATTTRNAPPMYMRAAQTATMHRAPRCARPGWSTTSRHPPDADAVPMSRGLSSLWRCF